jgi:potassium channel subfamily K
MMSGQSEPEFVLDRLCESLGRYMRRVERAREEAAGADAVKWEREGGDGYHCHDVDIDDVWSRAVKDKGEGSSGSSQDMRGKSERGNRAISGHDNKGPESVKRKHGKRRYSG